MFMSLFRNCRVFIFSEQIRKRIPQPPLLHEGMHSGESVEDEIPLAEFGRESNAILSEGPGDF